MESMYPTYLPTLHSNQINVQLASPNLTYSLLFFYYYYYYYCCSCVESVHDRITTKDTDAELRFAGTKDRLDDYHHESPCTKSASSYDPRSRREFATRCCNRSRLVGIDHWYRSAQGQGQEAIHGTHTHTQPHNRDVHHHLLLLLSSYGIVSCPRFM